MPHDLADMVNQNTLKTSVPIGLRVWWIRGKVMHQEQITRPNPIMTGPLMLKTDWADEQAAQDTHLAIADIDNMGDGYDVRITGLGDFRENDIVSLFGCESVDSTHISFPRYMVTHNPGYEFITYPDVKPGVRGLSKEAHRDWLVASTSTAPPSMRSVAGLFYTRGDKIALVLAVLIASSQWLNLFAFMRDFNIVGGFFLLVGCLICTAIPFFIIRFVINRFFGAKINAISTNRQYFNLAAFYSKLGKEVHASVLANPDYEAGFVCVPRGSGTQGKLTPPA